MYEEKHYGTWETLIVPDKKTGKPDQIKKEAG